jgi:hypothetical protein
MIRRALLTVAALVAACYLGGGAASAQTVAVNVDFPFIANGQSLPAGRYSVDIPASGPVVLNGPEGKRVILSVVTVLGRHDRDADPEFVFDKSDGKVELSEVWPSGGRDGILVLATAKPHTHAVVGGSNPKK